MNRSSLLLFALLLIAPPVQADALADLRRTLERFPAVARFAATGTVEVRGGAEGAARSGQSTFEVESGSDGFRLRILPETIQAAENEALAKKRNPESPTPTRTAMVALTLFEVIDAIDAASMLSNDLAGAKLIEERRATLEGKEVTLLRLKVKSSLASQGRFVNEPKIELRVWIGSDGIPVAAERDSEFSASFLFVKAGNVRSESWAFAIHGDRLYATRNAEIDRATVAGKSMVNSRTVSYRTQ